MFFDDPRDGDDSPVSEPTPEPQDVEIPDFDTVEESEDPPEKKIST